MADYKLKLIPLDETDEPFSIPLYVCDGNNGYSVPSKSELKSKHGIFSDINYEFELIGSDEYKIQNIKLFIDENEKRTDFDIQNRKIHLDSQKIFQDYYGIVEIRLTIIFSDKTEINVKSQQLHILVRKGGDILNESIKKMVQYIYDHQTAFFSSVNSRQKISSGLNSGGDQTLIARLSLAEKIAVIYKNNYEYFKANSRFEFKKIPSIDKIEHMPYISPQTLRFITSHPEYLQPTKSTINVRIGNTLYQPQKVLSLKNECCRNIYENRVILNFIQKIINDIDMMDKKCAALLQKNADKPDTEFDSAYFIFAQSKEILDKSRIRIHKIHKEFGYILGMYQNAMMIKLKDIKQEFVKPYPTAIFMSIPQYREIFNLIDQWFDFGTYDFKKEEFLLSLIRIAPLYETYLLAKMLTYFDNRAYICTDKEYYHYPVSEKKMHNPLNINNTYSFTKGIKQITLYYQPFVYCQTPCNNNKIGLYRNNSLGSKNYEEYYTPDFLIKIRKGNSDKYLIFDAKFSSKETVKTYYVKDLVWKYINSISPITSNDSVLGLCIIYGKCTENDKYESIYDKQLSEIIFPLEELLPLSEEHNFDNYFDSLIRRTETYSK